MPRTDLAPVCPKIQIAGIIDRAEADMLVASGVDSLGFPLRLAVHAEDISLVDAAAIVSDLPSHVAAVCITYLTHAQDIIDLCDTLGTHRVQLHADVSPNLLRDLKARRPDMSIIKSIIVPPEITEEAMTTLRAQVRLFSPHVDAFLTDSFDPTTGATGATGKPHDWAVDSELVRISPRPIILAGGLSADNVRRAINEVRPAAVDAHTGVEGAEGRKSHALTEKFVANALAGFEDIA